MSKLINTMFLFAASAVMFAEERGSRFPEDQYQEFGNNDGANFGGQFTPLVPVDQYTMILVALGVAMIAFFAYKRLQAKKA